jgi:hypothetical protein
MAIVAAPAGAQPDTRWIRHQGPGFSVDLPSTWADATKDRARLLRKTRALAGDDARLASIIDNLMAAGDANVAVKMIAFDLEPSSLRSGFATNLNVVRERTSLPLQTWGKASLRALISMSFVVQPIWSQPVRLPAGKAIRLTYKARFALGGKRLETSITQYGLVKAGFVYVFTYTTLPRLASRYRSTFARSARLLRVGR